MNFLRRLFARPTTTSTPVAPQQQFLRVWTLGSLDHKVVASPASVKTLQDHLLANPTDIVWGPDLKVTVVPRYAADQFPSTPVTGG